jgi:hypothetical protein
MRDCEFVGQPLGIFCKSMCITCDKATFGPPVLFKLSNGRRIRSQEFSKNTINIINIIIIIIFTNVMSSFCLYRQ